MPTGRTDLMPTMVPRRFQAARNPALHTVVRSEMLDLRPAVGGTPDAAPVTRDRRCSALGAALEIPFRTLRQPPQRPSSITDAVPRNRVPEPAIRGNLGGPGQAVATQIHDRRFTRTAIASADRSPY